MNLQMSFPCLAPFGSFISLGKGTGTIIDPVNHSGTLFYCP
jgi:hypothetical protein